GWVRDQYLARFALGAGYHVVTGCHVQAHYPVAGAQGCAQLGLGRSEGHLGQTGDLQLLTLDEGRGHRWHTEPGRIAEDLVDHQRVLSGGGVHVAALARARLEHVPAWRDVLAHGERSRTQRGGLCAGSVTRLQLLGRVPPRTSPP